MDGETQHKVQRSIDDLISSGKSKPIPSYLLLHN